MASSSSPSQPKRVLVDDLDFDSPAPKAKKLEPKAAYTKDGPTPWHFDRDGQAAFEINFTEYKEVKKDDQDDLFGTTKWEVKKTFVVPASITAIVAEVNALFSNWTVAVHAEWDNNFVSYRGNTPRLTLYVAHPKDCEQIFRILNKHGLITNAFAWQQTYKTWEARAHSILYRITENNVGKFTLILDRVPNVLHGALEKLGGNAPKSDQWKISNQEKPQIDHVVAQLEKLAEKFGLETELLRWCAIPDTADTPLSCPCGCSDIHADCAQNPFNHEPWFLRNVPISSRVPTPPAAFYFDHTWGQEPPSLHAF